MLYILEFKSISYLVSQSIIRHYSSDGIEYVLIKSDPQYDKVFMLKPSTSEGIVMDFKTYNSIRFPEDGNGLLADVVAEMEKTCLLRDGKRVTSRFPLENLSSYTLTPLIIKGSHYF